ncbi:MAG: response regulator transcription factor [Clostridiales bacterium]|nr:response regulator transcription factor [Clostridiales bacterium]
MERKRILVVDDEENILELIRYNLESNGFDVSVCDNGEDAIEIATREIPDLIILDLMLPGIDGYEVLKKIRIDKATSKIPVIMLTAKGDEADKVIGLELGADDYVTKPFGIRELVARIKAALRRTGNNNDNAEDTKYVIKVDDIVIDIRKHEVTKGGAPLELTLREFRLLEILAENRGNVVSRDVLFNEVWGYDSSDLKAKTRTLDVHIRMLRKKIGSGNKYPIYIETIRGLGYKMK